MNFFAAYQSLLDILLINCFLAFSQYIVLRAGVFSLATAGITSIGAYAAALLVLRAGMPAWLGAAAATGLGLIVAVVLALPLARLRGVFQAIATISFVQIVVAATLYAENITGGAIGINGIPKLVSTGTLLALIAVLLWLLSSINASSIGRAFDAIREDETVAATLGISIVKYHIIAFALSGSIAGLGGAFLAFNTRSLTPEQFGFGMLVLALGAVVLGGRVSIWGPVLGAGLLTVLPELARPLADQRLIVHGALLMIVITFLPDGIVDSLRARARKTPGSGRRHWLGLFRGRSR